MEIISLFHFQLDSPELLELNEKFIQLIRNHQIDCLSFGETKKCTLLKKPIEWRALLGMYGFERNFIGRKFCSN